MPSLGTYKQEPTQDSFPVTKDALNAAPVYAFGGAIGSVHAVKTGIALPEIGQTVDFAEILTSAGFVDGATPANLRVIVCEVDSNGNPIAGGVVDTYDADGTARKIHQDLSAPLLVIAEPRGIFIALDDDLAPGLDAGAGTVNTQYSKLLAQ